MKKSIKELELNLIEPTLQVKKQKPDVRNLQDKLFNMYAIQPANTGSWIKDPRNQIPNLDSRLLYIFSNEIYELTKDETINPKDYFTDVEIKKAQQYDGRLHIEEKIELPVILEDVIQLTDRIYIGKISIKTMAEWDKSQLVHYNFNIQRGAKKVVRNGEILLAPRIDNSKVNEIKQRIKNNKQKPDTLTINASLGTSDEGEELKYDKDTRTLTITKGTIMDIVDGYHRWRSASLVINETPESENFYFGLTILNFTEKEAADYQAQLAKQTPFKPSRIKELAEERFADKIVNRLKIDSELKGKIGTDHLYTSQGELVTSKTLSDTIDRVFEMERPIDMHKVFEYLKEWFDIFIGIYEKELVTNISKTRKETYMAHNGMFAAYILIAATMFKAGIEPSVSEIKKYIDQIDYSKSNPLWKEIGYVNSEGNIHPRGTEAIIRHFEQFEV